MTTNLGATWTVQHLPANVVGTGPLGCATAQRCWEVAFTYQGRQTLLLGTTDGGRHWRTRWSNSSGVGLFGFACPTARSCVSVGGVVTGPSLVNTRGVVMTTTNAGASWQRRRLPPGVGTLAGVSCPTSADCWAVGASNTGRAPYYSVIVSRDGGRTWQHQVAPTFADAPQFGAISCTSTTDCWAAGSGGLEADVLATTDGGN